MSPTTSASELPHAVALLLAAGSNALRTAAAGRAARVSPGAQPPNHAARAALPAGTAATGGGAAASPRELSAG